MAYKYEVEQKAQQLRFRVLIAIYILFVISAAIIGVSVRLQQIRNIQPSRPGAADVGTVGYTLASDPTYTPRNLNAFAYCAVVDGSGNETGTYVPISGARFFIRQLGKRDVGQVRANATNTQNTDLCTSVPAGCSLPGTVAQCQAGLTTACGATVAPGVMCPGGDDIRIAPASGMVTWPGSQTTLGDLRWDDNEILVMVDLDYGPLDQGQITYNSVTYSINKSSAVLNSPQFTPGLGSLLPFYKWQCQTGCTDPNTCSIAGNTYSGANTPCTFSGNTFNCPQRKFLTYAGAPFLEDASDDAFAYTRAAAFREATDPTRVHVGFGYDGIVDSSYPTPSDTSPNALVAFNGNLVKYRFTCTAESITTPTPTPTESPTPTPTPSETPSVTPTATPSVSITPTDFLITAHKTGPACVERVDPNNRAVFTVTVNNNGTNPATITSVADSLPQGFTYLASTTTVNGSAVPDTYVETTMVGNSQLVRFTRPTGAGGPWVLAPNAALVIQFTAVAGANAITGTNTNQVVIDIQDHDSVDNVTYQFEVAQTCVPITGIFDEPIFIIGASVVIIFFGLYLIYNPKAVGIAEKLYARVNVTRKQINKTAKKLKNNADPRRRFEEKVKGSLKDKRKK